MWAKFKPGIFLALTLTGIFFCWQYPISYPLKILIVFFHESSHALMTLVTGGQVTELVVDKMQGGHVLSIGGNRFLILSAGYLGSLFWGITLYLLAVKTDLDKFIMFLLGLVISLIAALYVRELFALGFSISIALAMIFLSWYQHTNINDFVLRCIGLSSMFYVPLDIYSDTIARSHLRSDAFMLAEEFGGTTLLWGGIWLVISVFSIANP